MNKFDRRFFLKLMGKGTAALGIGMGISTRTVFAKTDSANAASIASAKGKYQTFNPGEYLDWEKKVVEERLAQAAGKAPLTGGMMGFPGGGSGAISQAEIVSYNSKWDPYNPLFNDKAYAQRAGYPDIPAFPCFKTPMGNSPAAIPRDLGDKW